MIMNFRLLAGLMAVLGLGAMWLYTNGSESHEVASPDASGAMGKFESIPAVIDKWQVISAAVAAAIALYLWGKFPILRYIFVGVMLCYLYMVFKGM
jgi:hypothetical protein